VAKRANRFEDLVAWQRARVLMQTVRGVTRRAGLRREFTLVDQLLRAARSTMANIAEGFERRGAREFAHHLSMANGSNAEVRSDLYVVFDAGYITESELQAFQDQACEVGRIVGALHASLLRSVAESNR
jgi:four helix bundle protein